MIQLHVKAVENLVAEFEAGKVTEENFYKSLQRTAKLGLENIRQHKIWDNKSELKVGDMVIVDHHKVAGRKFQVKELKRVKVVVVNPNNEFESYIVPLSMVKKA